MRPEILKSHKQGAAVVSLRIGTHLWMDDARRVELLGLLRTRRDTIEEVAFFTSFTHSVLPRAVLDQRAALLTTLMPEFKALKLRVGINHLTTLGHLDENLDHSLNEPWQRITDINGTVARGCFCPLDPHFQDFTRECYKRLAEAGPDFIWIDDDVRMNHHAPAEFCCFCPLCLARFAEETGEAWTRERAAAELQSANANAAREARARWFAHNRRILDELFALIRAAVDEVNPRMVLGFMPIGHLYEGMAYEQWGKTLAGSRSLPVKWRPGGGFYTDAKPLDLLRKAHNMGRMAEAVPAADRDIQYEHENFPYQKLKKSETIFVAEVTAALAAGCNGVALNLMGISPDPCDEYLPYLDRIRDAKPFFDRMVSLFERSPAEGLWPAMTSSIWAAGTGPESADPLPCLAELAEIGLPPAYSAAGATVSLLVGDAVRSFSRDELETVLAGAAIIDGPALRHLEGLGLTGLTGFETAGARDRDTLERFTDDPLNGSHAGWWRDCRPSFWRVPAFVLRPLSAQVRILAELIDFERTVSGPVMGIFENRLGGRVAVLGYYPWSSLQNLAKSSQMKQLCRWLSGDRLPAYVSSFHKIAIWCRRDGRGQLAIPLINASLDAVMGVRLHMAATGPYRLVRLDGREEEVPAIGREGPYTVMELPALAPWEQGMLIS